MLYHELYDGRGFSRLHNSWQRYRMGRELLAELGLTGAGGPVRLVRPEPATEAELLAVHTPEHLAHVRRKDAEGTGFVDYGDTPAYPGVWRRATVGVGASLRAVRMIMRGVVSHAFNPSGGLHHAHRDRAGGFCIFNDLVVAVRALQREFGLERIAIVDVDGHHGDGTQALLYDEPILTISLHQYDGRFYPRTGALDETGSGAGAGYNLNLPLLRRTGDAAYRRAFEALVLPRLHAYRPEFILLQYGTDGHYADPLVALWLTTDTYRYLAETLHRAAHDLCGGRLAAFGGGGYHPAAVVRCWAIMLAALAGAGTLDRDGLWERLRDPAAPAPTEPAAPAEPPAALPGPQLPGPAGFLAAPIQPPPTEHLPASAHVEHLIETLSRVPLPLAGT
jgi:acetoin utilization protein AcuC